MTSISWVILTYNRGETVQKSVMHNFEVAGAAPDELIWVDNGSTDKITREFMSSTDPDVAILNNENLGVSKGYNRGLGLATKDYIVITGSDMIMPDNWLTAFKTYVEKIPETGVACIYSHHWTSKKERLRKQYGIQNINGLPLVHAMPIERRIFKRELLADFGYFPESLGLYGFDDVAWAKRAERVCDAKGLLYYVIPDLVAEHLGTEGVIYARGQEAPEYHAFKKREAEDPAKRAELNRLRDLGWPRYTPYL